MPASFTNKVRACLNSGKGFYEGIIALSAFLSVQLFAVRYNSDRDEMAWNETTAETWQVGTRKCRTS